MRDSEKLHLLFEIINRNFLGHLSDFQVALMRQASKTLVHVSNQHGNRPSDRSNARVEGVMPVRALPHACAGKRAARPRALRAWGRAAEVDRSEAKLPD